MRYFLRLSYDGTDFHGWQRQPNAPSVQQKIEEALGTVLRHDTPVTGAGRTDTGVHAREMYAHFDSDTTFDPEGLKRSLNNMCGHSIAIHDILRVKDDAHARFDATARTYQYRIITRKDPFQDRYAWRLQQIPDLDVMNWAAALLLLTADFTSFAKLHGDAKTNICNVSNAAWTIDEASGVITFTITADRFLRNMVRAVVGTLIEVGRHKLSIPEFRQVIRAKDRCEAGMSVPAKGLFLTRIEYPDDIFKV
ncbi:MAG: tRNA pseudouridine(38-40) synthase TruA [Muribaculaceae bacterium]|nr:tRNA pseudouridine(38-40) synthase TruA [Muribaculaceae bacterium]